MNPKIQKAIQLIHKEQPLFTVMVAELSPVESNDVPTAATDGGKIFYNNKFIDTLTEEETAAVLLHETLHCAFLHLWRREKRDSMKWNIACDYAINNTVNESFPLPKGGLLDSKYFGMSAEDIYDKLPKSKKMKQQAWGDHSKWGEQGKKKQSAGQGIMDKIKKMMGQSVRDPEVMRRFGDSQNKQKWKGMFDKVMLQNYGKMPDSIKRLIEKNYYIPVIDWSALVSNLLSEDTNDYTFSQPDRRFPESDFILPGLHSFDKLKDVVFAYDTSGSINQQDLHAFYMETMSLFENFSSLQGWIAICDASLHSFKSIDAQTSYDQFDFTGGGGTSFRPVFQEIKKQGLTPKAVFYFTDTQGDFPDEKPDYPVFWLVRSYVGDSDRSYVPFGEVVKFLSK